jgi:hypothetical protein
VQALALLALSLFAAVGPNGLVVERSLRPAGDLVPVQALIDVTPELWVVYHQQDDLAMAYYFPPSIPPRGRHFPPSIPPRGRHFPPSIPPERRPPGGRHQPDSPAGGAPDGGAPNGAPDFSLLLMAATGGFERLLPALDVPRLFLYAPYYREGKQDGVAGMPLDVAEYLFNALLEALFDRRRGDLPVAFEERVRRAMPSAPEECRREAYLAAVSDFGSQAFSIALELRRSAARLRAAGKDPCPAVRHPATLFGAWGKLFNEQEFRGRYTKDGRQVHLSEALTAEDKRIFVRAVLGSEWTGDVHGDFNFGCAPQ